MAADPTPQVMTFDPGYSESQFAALIDALPGASSYPSARFRTEWGPIFHRGRLDGSARLLVIGQDPAAHEAIARRILCGEAGHRVQGFVWKLGLDHSYVMINSFLYSLYGTQAPRASAALLEDRYRWVDAILGSSPIEAVVTFGAVATSVWNGYLASRQPAHPPVHAAATHPTAHVTEAALLTNWNAALQVLFPALSVRDRTLSSLRLYGRALGPSDRRAIPAGDFPPGLPSWMTGAIQWAVRGDDPTRAPKAARITVTIPTGSRVRR
jgi:uracil-DNA glycosylase